MQLLSMYEVSWKRKVKANPCLLGFWGVIMNTMLSRPQVEFLQAQIMALEAVIRVGDFDAGETLARTRSIIRVVKATIETALKVETMKGYDFSRFD